MIQWNKINKYSKLTLWVWCITALRAKWVLKPYNTVPTLRKHSLGVTRRFPDRNIRMFNKLIRQGLAKNLEKCNVLCWVIIVVTGPAPEPSRRWVWAVILKRGKDQSPRCRSRRCWVGVRRLPFEIQLCWCVPVCARHLRLLTEWSTETIFDRTKTVRINLNRMTAQSSYDTGICLNLWPLQCTCWKS